MTTLKNILISGLCLSSLFFAQSCGGNSAPKNSASEKDNQKDFIALFDQNSLEGWEGDSTIWKMNNGILTGEIKEGGEPLKNNTFLIWKGGEPEDFILKAKFKISELGNSGINYRSDRFTQIPFALAGYQADIDGQKNYTGQNYEERKRTTLAYRGQRTVIEQFKDGEIAESRGNAWSNMSVLDTIGNLEALKDAIKSEDWNEIEIVAEGYKLSHYVNGKLMSEVIDNDSKNRNNKGLIGMQVHVGPPMKVEYKDMYIKILK